jgi:hypothetical protein
MIIKVKLSHPKRQQREDLARKGVEREREIIYIYIYISCTIKTDSFFSTAFCFVECTM